MPDRDRAGDDADRARRAGIDPATLDRLLDAMGRGDAFAILTLCARDMETTRRGVHLALRRWDRRALERHLHVMSSLALTIGAVALADETARLQALLRKGTHQGYDAPVRRLDALARRAIAFLADVGA